MEKNKTPMNFGSMMIIIIILIVMYLALENLLPFITEVIQEIEKSKTMNNTAAVSIQTHEQQFILYEDQQKIKQSFPNNNFKGTIYFNIYGKKVLESDTSLDLSDVVIDANLQKHLKMLPSLKEVNLYNQNLSKDEKIILQQTFPNIKFQWLVDVLGEEVDCNIETLDLSRKQIPNIEDFKKSLILLTNLKKLDMSYTNLSNEELGNLREQFPNTRIDWVVHLSKWSVRTDAVSFSVLVTQYDYRRMTTEDIQVLKYCTELQALDLGHQAIQDISVLGEYLPNLRVLILADNRIKDISPLANMKHLHYLELFMNDITDATPLAECKELVDLNISFNYRFSDINGILELPLLERLWLVSDRIPAESYNLIRQTYPNVKLVTTGSGSTESGWRTHERYFAMIDMYRKNYISDVFLKYDNK